MGISRNGGARVRGGWRGVNVAFMRGFDARCSGEPKRRGPKAPPALQCRERSEALLVLHVPETTDVEAAVVRDAAVWLRVHLRTPVVGDVVRTQRRGGVPGQLDRELQVVNRVRAGAVSRIRGARIDRQ